jgi:hypothetical protein
LNRAAENAIPLIETFRSTDQRFIPFDDSFRMEERFKHIADERQSTVHTGRECLDDEIIIEFIDDQPGE